jgi:hypothetical protein
MAEQNRTWACLVEMARLVYPDDANLAPSARRSGSTRTEAEVVEAEMKVEGRAFTLKLHMQG